MMGSPGPEESSVLASRGLSIFPLVMVGYILGFVIARLARNANGSNFTSTAQFAIWTAAIGGLISASSIAFLYSLRILRHLRKRFTGPKTLTLILAYVLVGLLTLAVERALGDPDTALVADYSLPRILFLPICLGAVAPAIMGIWVIELTLRRPGKHASVILRPSPPGGRASTYYLLAKDEPRLPTDQARAKSITISRQSPRALPRAQILSDLLFLRTMLLTLLLIVGSVIGIAVLAIGALRLAILAARTANGDAVAYPIDTVVVNGLFYSALLALFYVPAYFNLQDAARMYLNEVFPVPGKGYYDHAQYENRSNLESLLKIEATVQETLKTGIAIASPLLGVLVATLLPTSA